MATYVNNLRLKEITTGDEDGTWGTSTNTNLELITDGFSYGTKEMAGDANETFTMPDGTADDTRSFYLKVTSAVSLTATREVTLGPNTISKVWLIENATSGSQIITIKQGSGATVNVANGSKVMVVSDGAGAGAAVLNANPTEVGGTVTSVGGTGTVQGLTLTGTVTSSGDLTLGGSLSDVDLTSQVTGNLPLANGGTGASLTDPGADRVVFWDDSAGSTAFLTVGSGLQISGTTLSSTDAGGTVTSVAVSGGTTGLTTSGGPITGSGTITLAGTLAVANGGTGITSLGSGVANFLGTPSSANLATALTDETGTGVAVFNVSPALTTPKVTTGIQNASAATVISMDSSTFFAGAFSDEVTALGNTGTAVTIDCDDGNVFTATLTGNCTFTLASANSTSNRATSFTLVLTNDGTAGRTVAFAGGTFNYPGGSGLVNRTTDANATDIWFFFSPDNGTTWYVTIPAKNLTT